jgi:hypothetical protein
MIREGFVIVVSILLAFGIDALWDERSEDRETRQALEAIEAELEVNRRYFAGAEATWSQSAEAGGALLHLTGPDQGDVDGNEVAMLIGDMWRRPDLEPTSEGVAETLISSGVLARIESEELRRELALWPGFIARQRELMWAAGSASPFHDRMVQHIAQLDFDLINGSAAIPGARRRFRSVAPSASRFESDWAGLLADREFESGVAGRTMVVSGSVEFAVRAQERIETLLALVRAELQGS